MNLIDLFFWFKKEPGMRILILISCMVGTLFGFYYYQWQFEITPFCLWPLVPDSPFFTFMYVLILIFYSFGVRSNTFDVFTFIGLNKVGLWTIFILFWNHDYYFSPATWSFRLVILLLHIGMIAVGGTLLKEMKKLKMEGYLLIFGFFVVHDLMDYVIAGTHPVIPASGVTASMWAAATFTLLTCSMTFYYLEKIRRDLV